eukprot:COSAG05_NODE_1640_length_4358_cov_23.070674_3_plen_67_part_00
MDTDDAASARSWCTHDLAAPKRTQAYQIYNPGTTDYESARLPVPPQLAAFRKHDRRPLPMRRCDDY